MQLDKYQEETAEWLQKIVISLDLCPFAVKVFINKTIAYSTINFHDLLKLYNHILKICAQLLDEKAEVTTALIIIPEGLEPFLKYLDTYELIEDLLEKDTPQIQLASFHPKYLFEGTQDNDVTNYTNRSPYPMIHLLRKADVSEAIDSYPEVHKIPAKNMETLKALGLSKMKGLI